MNIPDDFPRELTIASVAGLQPKLALRYDSASGRYTNKASDVDFIERYEICSDLVSQLAEKCRRNRTTKYAAMSEVQILERLLAQLLDTSWGTTAEMKWVIRATATELGWVI